MKILITTIAAVLLVGCRAQATDVAKFFFSGYSIDANMFGFYTTMGMIIIMSALASLTPIVMYYFTIRKWGAAAQIKFGAIYYTITLVIPVLLAVGFESSGGETGLFLLPLSFILFQFEEVTIYAATMIISVLVVLACHAEGADVNAKDDWGMTPLHEATREGHKEITDLLLTNGADVNAKDGSGRTPLDWAIDFKHTETADLIRKHGGKTSEELKAEGK
jgi:hypothetical protein